MPLDKLLQTIESSAYFKEKLHLIKKSEVVVFSNMAGSSPVFIYALLYKNLKNLVVLTSTTNRAENLKNEIETILAQPVEVFPCLDVDPSEGFKPSKELVGKRLQIINGWLENKSQLVIAPTRALSQKTISKNKIEKGKISLNIGQTLELSKLVEKLVKTGYQRQEIVGERGEFSVKGGIFDVFGLSQGKPVRIEFDNDKIASLRLFDVYSQVSTEKIDQLAILPAEDDFSRSVFEHLMPDTCLVADEIAEVEPLLKKYNVKQQIKVSTTNFNLPGQNQIFETAPSYVDKLEEIPSQALIISRHSQRIAEELGLPARFGALSGGFKFLQELLLTDKELFNEAVSFRKKTEKQQEGVSEELLADLKVNDFVVHENYGIAKYLGMQTHAFDEIQQEYLVLEFAKGDKVYVPPSMAGLVEKYSSAENFVPRLSSLGTAYWKNTKNQIKKSLRNITQELIKLYTRRSQAIGFAYPPDDVWQDELESTFGYEETPDQQKAILDTKKDMESAKPMDRLICGDVGYGKTEVAIRAAAKAVASGKQVAVLVPTTLLAEQHYNTFKNRFHSFPVKVEMLSRFRDKTEIQQVVKSIEAGTVDIIIGTHRLLQKDIKFSDLGLLVIDEEQRFGVGQKEKIKQIKVNVDVLSLSATPIPRTLYLTLSGARDMSVINTPPIDRLPIRTYVLPWNDHLITEAISREIDRGGQIYFVHNFVESIDNVAIKIKKLVPHCRVAVAHGQMQEKELEKTMLKFLDKQFDVLVSTSIIESGLDIPSVNTIIVDHADRFGLSQLYQIRGRVGRAAERAYAYMFYHPGRLMTEQALSRLKAIQEYSSLGSGYRLAMRDLEIRGAGNMLGAEQSGHIMEVGFELYCELLEQAVREAKGISEPTSREVQVDLKLKAFIPETYITDERQRMAIYRRMNVISSKEQLDRLEQELGDRFGPIPAGLNALLKILNLKLIAMQSNVLSIKQEADIVSIEWVSGKRKKIKVGGKDLISLVLTNILG